MDIPPGFGTVTPSFFVDRHDGVRDPHGDLRSISQRIVHAPYDA